MRGAINITALGLWVLAGATVSPVASGQATTPACPPGTTRGSAAGALCAPAPAQPAPKRFPYPGESTPEATPDAPSSNSGSVAPQAAPASGATPPGKRFPYPGEPAADTAKPDPQNGLNDAGSSGQSRGPSSSGSSSSSSSSSSAGGSDSNPAGSSSSSSSSPGDSGSPFTDPGPGDVPAPKKGRRKLPPVPRQTPSEREEEDVRIAGFYMNDGNFKAAYVRAQDAVSLDSDDAEAHLALAEAARKLGKFDEAQKHYKLCLDLDPIPKQRRVAERALKEMSGGA